MVEISSGRGKKPASILPPTIVAVVPVSEKLLLEACPALTRDVDELRSELDAAAKTGDAISVARAYVALHTIRETINGILGDSSPFSSLFNRYKTQEVREAFERANVPNVPLSEGFRVGLTSKVQATVRADVKPAAFQWLRDNDLGALIVETVNAQTLSAAATALLEEQNIELPSDLFHMNNTRNASVTRTK